MSNDNLLKFPKGTSQLPSVESVRETLHEMRQDTINGITEEIKDDILSFLSVTGFDHMNDESLLPETLLIIEAVRSLISKKFGEHHPFHDLAENIFGIDKKSGRIVFTAPNFKFVKPKKKSTKEHADH